MRSALKNAQGLGASGHGVQHWWAQRVSAVLLVPLVVWFVISAVMLTGKDYASVTSWIQQVPNTAGMILLLLLGFYHGALGLQVIIEDYVSDKLLRLVMLLLVKLAAVGLCAYGVVAVLRLSFGFVLHGVNNVAVI